MPSLRVWGWGPLCLWVGFGDWDAVVRGGGTGVLRNEEHDPLPPTPQKVTEKSEFGDTC